MAKKFLTDLNLMKNQLKQAVIENLAAAPEGAKLGQVYFDTLKSKFGVCVAIDEAGVRTWAYMSSAAELEAGLATKVDAETYATDKAALEGAIATKVEQEAYNTDKAALEQAIAAKVAQADYDAKMALLDAEDQKAAEHIANGDIHVTAEQKAAWTAKQDALSEAQLAAANSGITADKVATYDAYAGQIATKVETETFNAKVEEINGAIALKADQETTYTKDEVDEIVEGINSAIESSLPAQEGQAGKVLVTDGTDASWGYTTFIKEGKDGEKAGVSELVINKLTQTEYDELEAAGLINENELYITSDDKEYFTKQEVEAELAKKVDAETYATDKAALEAKDAELAGKIEALEAKDEELSGQIATKVETETFNAKVEEINGAIALKANAADVYTKGEVYTKDEADALLATKVNTESYATDKQALEGAIALKANAADVYTKDEVNGLVSSVYKFRGSVETFADLPTEGLVEGDVYNVKTKYEGENGFIVDAGDNVAWVAPVEGETEGHWDVLGGDVDLSGYYTKGEADAAFATKDELSAVSGGSVHKVVATNEELVPDAYGVASWTVEHNLGDDVNVAVKEIATGEEVVVDVLQMSNQVKIKMNADETIAAETYKVVING